MIQMMNRKKIIEMICWILSRWKTKRKYKKQTATDMNRNRQTEINRDPQKLPSTTSCYKACRKYFPVLLQACTKYVPVLLRTTKLAQSTSQYYFVVQSLHQVVTSTSSTILRTTKRNRFWKSQFYFSFWWSNRILCETVATEASKSQFYITVFHGRTSFRAKGLPWTLQNHNFTSVLTIEPDFVRKGCRGHFKITILPQFWRSNLISYRLPRTLQNHVFADRTSFRLPRALQNCNFTSIFDDQASFRAKGLPRTLQNRNSIPQFWRSNPHFGCRGRFKIASLSQFLTIEPHFVRKGCRGHFKITTLPYFTSILTIVLCERVAFRGASLALPRALREK